MVVFYVVLVVWYNVDVHILLLLNDGDDLHNDDHHYLILYHDLVLYLARGPQLWPLPGCPPDLSEWIIAALCPGVPQAMITRLEGLLRALERMQIEGQGPEGRWSISCLHSRLVDGIEALDALHAVISRRFIPQGYLPVRRIPRAEMDQWRLFNWGRNYADLFLNTLEANLNVRLQPADVQPSPSDKPTLFLYDSCQLGQWNAEESYPSSRSSYKIAKPLWDEFVCANNGELRGFWREPEPSEEDVEASGSNEGELTSSTTTTSLCSTWWTSMTSTSTTSTSTDLDTDAGVELAEGTSLPSTSSVPGLGLHPAWAQSTTGMMWTTTSTSSIPPTITWPTDVVRDVVNVNVVHGGQGDIIELLRRLLARIRRLRHQERLLLEAMEETMTWLRSPEGNVMMNVATFERNIF
ncbi:unnamed protein product [Symbiodinium sp. CCMP2592]|nr:unnamed protein product [Symbiodinium sp. CCMP2592]